MYTDLYLYSRQIHHQIQLSIAFKKKRSFKALPEVDELGDVEDGLGPIVNSSGLQAKRSQNVTTRDSGDAGNIPCGAVATHAINVCKTSFDIDPSQLPPVQNRLAKIFRCRCHPKLTKSEKQRSQIGEILFPIYPAQWFGRVHRLPVL